VLERRYDQAERGAECEAARKAVSGMEAFAKELKRDPQLDSLLRQRGREFGIADGSRLDRVVRGEGWTRELARELGLDHGLRRGGPSLGMGM
jgi:hypothetical protein